LAITLAPRSCPSSPGLATSTRILRWAVVVCSVMTCSIVRSNVNLPVVKSYAGSRGTARKGGNGRAASEQRLHGRPARAPGLTVDAAIANLRGLAGRARFALRAALVARCARTERSRIRGTLPDGVVAHVLRHDLSSPARRPVPRGGEPARGRRDHRAARPSHGRAHPRRALWVGAPYQPAPLRRSASVRRGPLGGPARAGRRRCSRGGAPPPLRRSRCEGSALPGCQLRRAVQRLHVARPVPGRRGGPPCATGGPA